MVYVLRQCYCNGADIFYGISGVLTDKNAADAWVAEFNETEWNWRDYIEMELDVVND